MSTSNSYKLDQEYRQRQLQYAERQQLANSVLQQTDQSEQQPTVSSQIFQANMISLTSIVVALILLVIFFVFSAQPAHAQTESAFDAGEAAEAGGSGVFWYLRDAVVALAHDDVETARDLMNLAVEEVPDFAASYIVLSYIALQEGDYEFALEQAEISVGLNPEDTAVYYVLAESHFALGNYSEALSFYETYIAMATEKGTQPILITSLLGGDSLSVVNEHVAICEAEKIS